MIPVAQMLAYENGAKAHRAKAPVTENPHTDPRLRKSWTAGWLGSDAAGFDGRVGTKWRGCGVLKEYIVDY